MENKYSLAIMIKPKNYFPINISDLKLGDFNITNLEELDNFTLKFTSKEIKKAIMDANLLDITEDMPLVVIYYEKEVLRNIKALTKDISFDMWKLI